VRFRSIQTRIAFLSGLCVLSATAALVGYGVVAANNNKSFVGEQVTDLSDRGTRAQLQTLASTQAGIIRSTLDSAFDAARNMARAFEVIAADQQNGATSAADRRTQLNAILLNVLKDNPRFNGAYSAWEPDALDGQDAAFRSHPEVGSDATGRFLPYWTRDAAGHVAIQPLVEYDNQTLHANGVMKGGWYIGPQNGGGESILDPLPYIVQGKNVYLATMSVPITIGGKFRGVAGADFDLAFVQQLAEQVKASVFGGQSSVTIISAKGLIVASSEHPEAIGRSIDQLNKNWSQYLPIVQAGREQVEADAQSGSINAFAPIVIGRTKTPWSVMIAVPKAVAMADATALTTSLEQRNKSDGLLQIVVAFAIAAAGVGAMWATARGISAPIARMTEAMRRLAGGDLSTEIPGAGRSDEIGGMAAAVKVFKDAAAEKGDLETEAATARRSADSERGRVEAERAAVAERQAEVVDGLASSLAQLAAGDLTCSLERAFAPEYERLRVDFNASLAALEQSMGAVSANTQAIRSGAGEISAASDDLSQRTEQQASSLEETAAALEEITATVKKTAEGAKHARDVVSTAKADAEKSANVVREAMAAMTGIDKSSKQISQIIGVIDEIAFQTNLLALNAGVEAARAGDAGRGFAVVASEVRALAQRSAEAAKEIKGLISASTAQVDQGVRLVTQTGEALGRIVAQVVEINDQYRRHRYRRQRARTGNRLGSSQHRGQPDGSRDAEKRGDGRRNDGGGARAGRRDRGTRAIGRALPDSPDRGRPVARRTEEGGAARFPRAGEGGRLRRCGASARQARVGSPLRGQSRRQRFGIAAGGGCEQRLAGVLTWRARRSGFARFAAPFGLFEFNGVRAWT
jgi:methyl-accepting chemotaxis protein